MSDDMLVHLASEVLRMFRARGKREEPAVDRAKKFFRKLLKGFEYVPRVIITDKLASYAAAKGYADMSAVNR